MQITEVVVSAGRTFNHPYEQYSNFRPSLTMKATFDPDGAIVNVDEETRRLQRHVESMVEG